MNILFIFHSPIIPQNGGVERVTSLLGTELKRRGHNIYYLATRSFNPSQRLDTNQLVIDCTNGFERASKTYLELLTKYKIEIVISQEATKQSINLLRITPSPIKKISVFHIQPFPYAGKERIIKKNSHPTDLARKCYRLFSILFPQIFHYRSLMQGRRVFNEMYAVSDRIVLLSNQFVARLRKYMPNIPRSCLSAINNPNTFDYSNNSDLSKEKTIIFVGRLDEPQKNVLGFIKMWKLLSRDLPDWKAIIIGDGSVRNLCEKYVKEKQIKNLTFVGKQSDVCKFYKRASFVCLTSHFEGWGMVLTEGMSLGCIPVCFDSYESCHDIIEDGVDGIIAKAFSCTDMASRIKEIAVNPTLFTTMSNKAKNKIRNFDISIIATEWETLLTDV